MGLQEFQVVGRHVPTESDPIPKIYRMRIFAPNEVVAKSRFWYFLRCVHFAIDWSKRVSKGSTGSWKRSRRPMARSLESPWYVSLSKLPLQPSRGRRNGIADYRALFFFRSLSSCFLCTDGTHSIPIRLLDSWEEATQGQELWHLDTIRLSVRNTQHVQGVPWTYKSWCCEKLVSRYGCQASRTLPLNPRMLL